MALRVGLDLVAVQTVEQVLRSAHGEHYLERVYTAAEIDDCRGQNGEVEAERVAARFAAKEATIKAIPGSEDGVSLTDIEVRRARSGRIELEISGKVAELADQAGIKELAISLTHEAGFAAAVVVAA